MAQPDDPLRGIALSVAATTVFAASDATAKSLAAHLPVIEIIGFRYMVFVVFAVAVARVPDPRALWPRSVWLQVLRGLFVVGSAVLFVFASRAMQIAQASVISFISPVLITMLSIPLLGEVVGLRRWTATAVGLLGVVIVARPGTSGFQPAALFGVASSACWALALVITRKMTGTERPSTTLLWTAGVGLAVLIVMLPFLFVSPTAKESALLLFVGILASTGQWLVVQAHRWAPASVLAPFSYTQLLWATFAGWLVFNTLPDRWTLVGAAIIIASGLYTAHRERVRARQAARGTVMARSKATKQSP